MEIDKIREKITRRHLFINGKWTSTHSGETFMSINPATGEVLSELDCADAYDVDLAVQCAERAQKIWWALDADERGRRLHKVAQIIRERAEEIAFIDTLDSGRPISDTLYKDLPRTAKTFEFFAGLTDKIRGATIPVPGRLINFTVKEPYGVVGAIIPWNYPFSNAVTKVAPAIATGNAVILKSAEQSPLSAFELGEILQQAGVPDGLVNILSGDGETGSLISVHPGIRKIAFTGSTEVGSKILQSSKYGIKSYTLELGGKSPNMVFADADLEQASDAALFSAFMNQGQTCTAGTRLFVQESIYVKFLDILLNKAKRLEVGNPMDPTTKIGAIISKEQYSRVLDYIDIGRKEASLMIGGTASMQPKLKHGFFVEPTIFSDVTNNMKIAREEIFGPVLSVLRFKDEDELVQLANDTGYGLACAIWTANLARAHRLATRIEAGLVWVNTIHSLAPGSPYGGFKQSGIGTEMGLEVADQYMKTKSIWIGTGDYRSPWMS